MLNFTYHIPTIIYFGKGQVCALEEELRPRAKKVLIVTGQASAKKYNIFEDVIKQVKKAGIDYVELSGIEPNPRLKSVYKGIEICRKESVDFILPVGGGSVVDAAKTIAAGVRYDGDVWDFFVTNAEPEDVLPVGVVLTLAATGSEMNGNAVITRQDTQRKLALYTPLLRPVFSILDPEYTYTVDRYNTAAGVVDIMVHVFEQYFSRTPAADVQDRIAEALLKVCIRYGPVVYKSPENYDARANILWAGSLALNDLIGDGKEGDWASHRIEHELSAVYDISHGAGLSILTPSWMRYVLGPETVKKFVDYGVNVWGIDSGKPDMEIADEAIDKTLEFSKSLGLPTRLGDVGITDEHFESMAQRAIETYGSLGSFRELGKKDIVEIFRMSL